MSGFSLKDQLFNREKAEYLAGLFAAQDPSFDARAFVQSVMKKLPALELKQRIVLIAEILEGHLPTRFPNAAAQILRSLPPPLDPDRTDDDFGDFIFAPLGEFVVRNGLTPEFLNLSLETLREITQRFSMEDALRAFLRKFPVETISRLTCWATDSNYHVRRLVSESTRPLLPWSGRVDVPVETTLPLLDVLHADRTRYVTRSVANHLNDIAKTRPDLVVTTLRRWHKAARQDHRELLWITRHALRTLVKRGHPDALSLLGYDPTPGVAVGEIRLARSTLAPGESLEFSVDISALRDEALVVDYAIDFVKAGGKRSVKVYKAAKLSLSKGETHTVSRSHRLLSEATTYRLYPGEHRLTIQINGQRVGTVSFCVSGMVQGSENL